MKKYYTCPTGHHLFSEGVTFWVWENTSSVYDSKLDVVVEVDEKFLKPEPAENGELEIMDGAEVTIQGVTKTLKE